MSEYKRWLSLDEQIAQLKVKGVQFSIMDENAARDYLFRQNNYFRITAYRRNFQRHPGGPKMGQYVRVEFAYLVDLAGIDRVLRDLILGMALDIEHLAKMEILQLVEINVEDGYSLVRDFVVGMDDNERRILDGEIARNRHNTYCGDMVRKYEGISRSGCFSSCSLSASCARFTASARSGMGDEIWLRIIIACACARFCAMQQRMGAVF